MLSSLVTSVTVVALSVFFTTPAMATLLGTHVSGGMFFGDLSENCFDSNVGCDGEPGSGTTVVIGTNAPAFVWPGFDFYTTADFSADKLIIDTNPDRVGATTNSIRLTFQDSAFSGLKLLSFAGFPSSSDFSYSLVGDTITIRLLPLSSDLSPYSLEFQVNSVPESSACWWLVFGLAFLGAARIRQSRGASHHGSVATPRKRWFSAQRGKTTDDPT